MTYPPISVMFIGGGTREPITSPSSAIRRMMMSWASTASGDVALVSTLSRLVTSCALSPGSTNGAPFAGAGVAVYANCDAGPVPELPDGVVTVTLTVPVPAGVVAAMSVSFFT